MSSSQRAFGRFACTFFTALFLSGAAWAQTTVPIGTVEANIDGASYRGETLHVPSEGTATAEVRDFGPLRMVDIQAHDPDAASIMRGVLSVEFGLISGADASATDASVSYFPEGMRNFYVSDEEPAHASVTLESLLIDGAQGNARGTFSSLLCKREGMMSEIDTEDCITVEGTFDTVLHLAD
ncbi:hypothetical protein JF546_21745 [Nitratireductor aquimarinus]|uniref:hypothetical protein n=1 Tax=Nitratireductor TaxID=245876 RepID=UPI001A8E96C2|nr:MULTISPECIES: hypothetical protein [Nitratireductor]MBN8245646.1 hypothetical protein [Nitratireductor aquimarinus]MBY6134029.1 hypothetical protein [Nitratireductor aquimarinus]MCA1302979.1 hypothetical protein [Nitratireductor aquimarinus]MCV0349734.1 hypothetical protein [Nitratireductor sp.]MDJ1465825.1 hypothetical protein [Nitratireductor sp. GZWM139]